MELNSFIGIEALKQAYLVQRKLLENNSIVEFVYKGRGLDKATRGDWESEEEIINFLIKENFPVRIISEEHGQIDITSSPKYLAVLDGIDGSSGLVTNQNSRCGTMLSIAYNLNPCYDNFFFGGLTEFSTGKIAYGIKDKGNYLIKDRVIKKIESKERNFLNPKTKIHIDDKQFYPDFKESITSGIDEISSFVKKTFSDKLKGKFDLSGIVSSSSMCLDLVEGKVDAVCGVIAKGVFEPPAEYRLVKEIGGELFAFVEGKWNELRNKKWAEYGRPLSPLIRVANLEIGKELIEYLK